MQAHARGGDWPRLYSAIAHVDIDLGIIGRALYRVSAACPSRQGVPLQFMVAETAKDIPQQAVVKKVLLNRATWCQYNHSDKDCMMHLQVRPSGWLRRVMWAVALMAMLGSFCGMFVLWLLFTLTRPSQQQSKGAAKEKKGACSDDGVSSEEGASDLATGELLHCSCFAIIVDCSDYARMHTILLKPRWALKLLKVSEAKLCVPAQGIWMTRAKKMSQQMGEKP